MPNYKFHITPLTPLHIGAGDALEPYQYAILNNRLYRFELEEFIQYLSEPEQNELLNIAGKNIKGLSNYIKRKEQQIKQAARWVIPADPSAAGIYGQRLSNPESDASLHPFIRTQLGSYIPGSSLKGAIRTALLYQYVRKPVVAGNRDANRLEAETFRYARYRDGVFRGQNIKNDPFKALKISDSQPAPDLTVVDTVTVCTKTRSGVWRDDVPMLREVSTCELSATSIVGHNQPVSSFNPLPFDLSQFKRPQQQEAILPQQTSKACLTHEVKINTGLYRHDKWLMKLDIESIIRACRQFYGLHLKEEAKYLNTHPQAKSFYDTLLVREKQLSSDSFIMRLGWGSGFDGVTVNYAHKYRKTKRSRRLTSKGMPLGWVEVKVEST